MLESGKNNHQSPSQLTIIQRSKSYQHGLTRKKSVHFADTVGLDLVTIMTRSKSTPKTFTESNRINLNSFRSVFDWIIALGPSEISEDQPVALVQLNAGDNGELKGIVKVNLSEIDQHAFVKVRYTMDNWNSFMDQLCEVENGDFVFSLFPAYYIEQLHIKLAICLTTSKGIEFWDNNKNRNYSISRLKQRSS